jgi:hypothetical protein
LFLLLVAVALVIAFVGAGPVSAHGKSHVRVSLFRLSERSHVAACTPSQARTGVPTQSTAELRWEYYEFSSISPDSVLWTADVRLTDALPNTVYQVKLVFPALSECMEPTSVRINGAGRAAVRVVGTAGELYRGGERAYLVAISETPDPKTGQPDVLETDVVTSSP